MSSWRRPILWSLLVVGWFVTVYVVGILVIVALLIVNVGLGIE